MYISWAAYYEGRSDSSYFNILIPRFLEVVLREEGVRPYDIGLAPAVEFGVNQRAFDVAAKQICERRDEFHLLFVHADRGGRAQQQHIQERREALLEAAHEECGFDAGVAILLSPKKELESWAIADQIAVKAAFGVSELPAGMLPASAVEAEKVEDPKVVLKSVSRYVGLRPRNEKGVLVRIAQEQDLDKLRAAPSFQAFEVSLRNALQQIGCIS